MKRFFLFMAVAVLALAGCTKKNGNEPVVDETQQPKDTTATDTTGAAVSLVGTWMTTDKAYSAVYFYYRDGSYCETVSTPLEDMGFTFRADGKVETPWKLTSKYVYENNQVVIDVVEGVKRVYEVRELTESHLVMEYRDTSEYFMDGGDTVIGYELEYWDMERE